MIEIIPTVVPAAFEDVLVAARRYPFAPALHIDAGDGRFVANVTWQPAEGQELPTSHIWEAHLMMQEPTEAGIRYAKAGASRIIAHLEAFSDAAAIPAVFDAWKAAGAREVGIALRLDTPLDNAPPADVLHLMTIASIGQQGEPFDLSAIPRIAAFQARFPGIVIAADGGINEGNIADLARVGVIRFCIGSALSSSAEPEAVYKRLYAAAGTVQ